MLQNFFDALKITGAIKNVKRFILTTGCKQYGVHLGVPKNPMEESDKWLSDPERPPNFYYRQQEILHTQAQEHGFEWVVTYPNDVIGVAKGNFMNLASTVGLYAAVSKEMGVAELEFPGSPYFYTRFDSFTYSKLHARFNAWAATAPGAANQAFNVVNGDVESWQNLWPKMAAKFGLRIPETMFSPEELEGKINQEVGSVMPLMEKPPLSEFASVMGLSGDHRNSQSKVEAKIDLMKWSQRQDVQAAWEKLQQRHGLDEKAFEGATWGFLNFVLGRNFDLVISMSKARKAGWTGYEDTWTSLSESLDDLVEEKVLPPFDNEATHQTHPSGGLHGLLSRFEKTLSG